MTTEQRKEAREKNAKQFKLNMDNLIAVDKEKHDYILNVPDSMQKLFYDVLILGIKGKRCLKAKCLDCCAYDKREITLCDIKTCPLHADRPYQRK